MQAAAYKQEITRANLKPQLPWKQFPLGGFGNLDIQVREDML